MEPKKKKKREREIKIWNTIKGSTKSKVASLKGQNQLNLYCDQPREGSKFLEI